METKVCTKCKEEKSVDDFLFRNKKKAPDIVLAQNAIKSKEENLT